MKRTVTDCDMCGNEVIQPVMMTVQVGSSPDPAGGSATPNNKSFDLCAGCMTKLFVALKKQINLSFETAKWISDYVDVIRRENKNKK